MSERAKAFGGTPSAESASRKYRRFSFIPITPTNVRIFPLSIAPLAHHLGEWPRGRLYSVIFEVREDAEGEFYHLVTLWKATTAERKLYEEHTT